MFRFKERPGSGAAQGEKPTVTLLYTAAGSTDRLFVHGYAINATPAVVSSPFGTLHRQDVKIAPTGYDTWSVDVPFAKKKNETGEYTLSFDTTGGTVHLTTSKETIGQYPIGAAPDFKQSIGVKKDAVDGADIIIPSLKLTVSFKHKFGVITLPQIKQISAITGTVNSTTFLTFAPGEVLFTGATGSEGTDSDTTVQYSYVMSENAVGLAFGDVAGVAKKGHELAWIKFTDAVDAGPPKRPIKKPQFVYVERVYESTDFATIFGFGE